MPNKSGESRYDVKISTDNPEDSLEKLRGVCASQGAQVFKGNTQATATIKTEGVLSAAALKVLENKGYSSIQGPF